MYLFVFSRNIGGVLRMFWGLCGVSQRRIQIAHYKPRTEDGMDDILQIEHSGIYSVIYQSNLSDPSQDPMITFIENLNTAFLNASVDDNGDNTQNIITAVDNNYYSKFQYLYPSANSLSKVLIHDSNNNLYATVEHKGFWDADPATESHFYSLRLVPYTINAAGGQTTQIMTALIALPEDTIHFGIYAIGQNNITKIMYAKLNINAIEVNNNTEYLNTFNLHIFLGDTTKLRVNQWPTYKINTASKNTSIYKLPPTIHGYGTTIEAEYDINIISSISQISATNQLFYDAHMMLHYN